MERKQPDYFLPALIGGLLAGVVSAIPFFNCLCCLWVIAGAIFSTYLLAGRTPASLKTGDGLLVGTLSGIFGAIINVILNIPLGPIYLNVTRRFLMSMSRFMEEMPPNWEGLLQMRYRGLSPSLLILDLLLSSVLFAFFGAIGGLIGISLFGRKKESGVHNETKATEDTSNNQPGL
jgi:hypothetical protein